MSAPVAPDQQVIADPAIPVEDHEPSPEEMYVKQLAMKTVVGAVTYPLTLVKTLFQLGYEPYPLTHGKSLLVTGRACYFLPNGFVYARYLFNDVGFSSMFTGLESAVLANVTGGIVSYGASKYLDKYYPNVGGKPENLDKEEKNMTDHESVRVMVRTATRDTIARSIGIIVSRPFTVFMTRKIAQLISGELKYTDILSTVYRIGREEGPAGFFSGLVPQLLAEAITIWGVAIFSCAIERTLFHAEIDKHDESDEAARDHAAHTRRLLHFAVPFFMNTYSYPFQVVSTVMAVAGSGLAASMLPYAPSFSIWQDAWHYLKPHGLRRGARLFLREHKAAVTVGGDNQLYANFKHFA
uniref:Mitochondrial carrier n=1 Tax=Steinernema glaseri TaxID=37863 RepID=A0A1I8ABD9_9BILA